LQKSSCTPAGWSKEELLRYGLLNRLVTPHQVLPAALENAGTFAANDGRMVQGAKRMLHEGKGSGFRERLDRGVEAVPGPLRPKLGSEAFVDFLARKAV